MDTPLQTVRILCQFWFKKKSSKPCCPLVQSCEGAGLCWASLPSAHSSLSLSKAGRHPTAHEASHPGESSLYTCKHSPTPRGKSGPKISYKGPSASHTQANSHCTETAPQAVLAFHWSVAPSQLSSTFFSTQSSLRCSSRPAESSHALSTDGKQTQAYCVLFLLTPGVGLCFKILVPCTENYLDTKNSQGFSVLGSHREQLGSSYTCPHTYCLRMVTSLSDILNNN